MIEITLAGSQQSTWDQLKKLTSSSIASDMYQRCRERNRKTDAAQALLSFCDLADNLYDNNFPELESGTASQTDLSGTSIAAMENEISHLQSKNEKLKQYIKRESPYSMESLKDNDEKVKYFTGLRGFTVLLTLYNYLEAYLPTRCSMSKFESLVLVLLKLKTESFKSIPSI